MRVYLATMARWIAYAPRGQVANTLTLQIETHATTVVEWLRHREEQDGLSVRSIVHSREILRSWFHWLWDLDLIGRLPLSREARKSWRIRPERIERGDGTRQALLPAEGQLLAKWALTDARPVQGVAVLLQAVAGLRSFEVASLDRRHLTLTPDTQRLVVVGKGGRQRVVSLEPVVVKAWRRYERTARLKGERGALLVHDGRRFSRSTIQSWAKQGLRAAGRPDLSSHDLRRTSVTLLMDRGATLEQAQRLLGHSSMELTARCYVARHRPLSTTTGITDPSETP